MKKINIWILVFITAFVVGMTGCGKVQDKVSEKVSEGIIEKAVGGKVDITKDGINVQKDGAGFQSGNNLKWPKSSMGDIPEPKAKINGVMDDRKIDDCTVVFTELDLDNAKAYVEQLKALGYKDDGLVLSDEKSITFMGKNSSKRMIIFSYKIEAKDGIIEYTKTPD